MTETTRFPLVRATVLHRVTGSVTQTEAECGAGEALAFVRGLLVAEGPLKLMLDLRGTHFVTLQAHRARSMGFARHPTLPDLVCTIAIVATDTPALRAEQGLIETEELRFFVDTTAATAWLEQMADESGRGLPIMKQ